MRVLLDTHALLWWLTDDPSLPGPLREVIADPANEIIVSAASAWEIATKHRLGKLPEASAVARDLDGLLVRAGMRPLPISIAHALRAGALEGHHRDPFDRMLIAQGQLESLPIMTADPAFGLYDVELLWRP